MPPPASGQARAPRPHTLLLGPLLLLLAPTAARALRDAYPVRRPVMNLSEAAQQMVARDGPRYPDEGFLRHIRAARAPYGPAAAGAGAAAPEAGGGVEEWQAAVLGPECEPGFAVLTIANQYAMQHLVPRLLDSLQRLPVPSAPPAPGGAPSHLARHTVVVGVTQRAADTCRSLAQRYGHVCATDGGSGLSDGSHRLPDVQAVAFGMAKLKYVVNALTTNTDVLWLDADVVVLRDPLPYLRAAGADLAVLAAPPGCRGGAAAVPYVPPPPDDEEGEEGDEAAAAAAGDEAGEGDGAAAEGGGGGGGGRRSLAEEAQQAAGVGAAAAASTSAAAAAPAPPALLYDTGVAFYRSAPGPLRCAYSLLLDVAWAALKNNSKLTEGLSEAARYGAFMPTCAGALELRLHALAAPKYVSACGGGVSGEAAKEAVLVHAGPYAPGDGGGGGGGGSDDGGSGYREVGVMLAEVLAQGGSGGGGTAA